MTPARIRTGLAAAGIVLAATAQAQNAAPPAAPAPALPALRDLLAQGYEVRATMLVPSDVVGRNSRSTIDAVVITIQRGASIGTCYTAFSAFVDGDFADLACVVKP
ncbi:MAG: hypothetical protein U1E56_03370 [Bauldia sp.]